ncbi:MAG: SDR family NAD(P)-dependent oxidoreductase [Actinomycetota bacterium]
MGGRLAGKVALITGSTRGIGRATAVRFAEEGAAVVVTGRSTDLGAEVEREIRGAGADAIYVPMDVGNEEDVRAAVAAGVDRYGRLTTLVNNAAPTEIMGPGKQDRGVTDLENEGWDAILRVALTGVFWACKHAIPALIEAGGGSVLNISSGASVLGVPGLDAYTAAKGALNSLTRSIAVEYASANVRCNALVVGMVLTGEGAHVMAEDPVLGPAIRAIHLTRLGRPEDIANAALFLSSDEAEFVTGALLPVDGGVTAKMNVPDISAAAVELPD